MIVTETLGIIKFVAFVILMVFIVLAFGPELRPLIVMLVNLILNVVKS